MVQWSNDNQEPKKYYGKYPGLVLKSTPFDRGDHTGEILVQVSGLLEDAEDEKSRELIRRPMQVMAKPCFQPGFFFVPEDNAQVWIEFAAGDINTPIWTGVWYPQDKTPRTVDDKAPTQLQKVIHTASDHILQFDDSNGQETIVIKDKKNGHKITLNKDGIAIESASKTIKVTCEKMEISGNVDVKGTLTVGTSPKTTIKGNEITGG